MPGAERNGGAEPRVANTTNISFARIESESLLIGLDSGRSGCLVRVRLLVCTLEPSHVLRAMGLPHPRTLSSIRFSLGESNTEADVDRVITVLPPLGGEAEKPFDCRRKEIITRKGLTERLQSPRHEKTTNSENQEHFWILFLVTLCLCGPHVAGPMRIVAMSGGVDSSVAAALLAEQGHDVIGVSMQLYDQSDGQSRSPGVTGFGTCCQSTTFTTRDVLRLRSASHITSSISRPGLTSRWSRISFVSGEGRTPIPCAHCNADLKFSTLLGRALGFGADGLATGHYARVEQAADGTFQLRRGADLAKDQTYFCFDPGATRACVLPGWASG